MRRDLLVAWSYRLAFFGDWIGMLVQLVTFALIGRLVDPGAIPAFGSRQATYLEFAAVGIALSSFMAVALGRVHAVIRQEQLQGTLESLLITPTAYTTIQMGSVAYDLAYVPVRTLIFFGFTSLIFTADFQWSGVLPTVAILVAYIPFVWGIGIAGGAWVLTFRRGTGVIGIAMTLLTLGSGTYFPVDVLPGWIQGIVGVLPLKLALDGVRDALLGGSGWAEVAPTVLAIVPYAAASLAVGTWAFRAALARERRRGTLGMY
jgi:ABC-2 type transport system permease protein